MSSDNRRTSRFKDIHAHYGNSEKILVKLRRLFKPMGGSRLPRPSVAYRSVVHPSQFLFSARLPSLSLSYPASPDGNHHPVHHSLDDSVQLRLAFRLRPDQGSLQKVPRMVELQESAGDCSSRSSVFFLLSILRSVKLAVSPIRWMLLDFSHFFMVVTVLAWRFSGKCESFFSFDYE